MLVICVANKQPSYSAEEETWQVLALRQEMVGARRFLAEGDAQVKWGERIIRAQRIEGDLETGWITATGNVMLTDERGELRASQIRFNLKSREGDLLNVRGVIEGIYINADTLTSDGNILFMERVAVTTCSGDPPEYQLSAARLTLTPALRLTGRSLSLQVGGRKWVTLPYLSRRIGRREVGDPLFPQIGYSQRRGMMIWYGDLLQLDEGQVRYGVRVFTRGDPELRLDFLRPLVRTREQEPMRRLELVESPGSMFLETLGTRGWRVEPIQQTRRGLFLSLMVNSPVENLQRTDLYLFGAELGYQTATPWGGGMLETEWRLGRLRESPTLVTAARAVAHLRWQSPTLVLHERAGADLVLDMRAAGYSGSKSYSWARAQWGFYYNLSDHLQVGTGLALATTSGGGPFAFDLLEIRREGRFRVRLLGAWAVDVLGKWDIEQRRWRDWQIALTPPAHCIQPQLIWSYQQKQWQLQLGLKTERSR